MRQSLGASSLLHGHTAAASIVRLSSDGAVASSLLAIWPTVSAKLLWIAQRDQVGRMTQKAGVLVLFEIVSYCV